MVVSDAIPPVVKGRRSQKFSFIKNQKIEMPKKEAQTFYFYLLHDVAISMSRHAAPMIEFRGK